MSGTDPWSLPTMNPTGRFSDRVGDYVKHRPGYPGEAVDRVLSGLSDAAGLVVADVGAGTGIFARLLGDRGARVLAVEPNEAMRRGAESHARVEWRSGTAEATGLADASVDVVTAAQAFHWFRAEEAMREFGRILKPGGRVALVWNVRSDADEATRAYREAILEASGHHPAEAREYDESMARVYAGFTTFERADFASEQALTLEGLIGRARSASYVPKEGARHERMVEALGALHRRFADGAGTVRLRYTTRVYAAAREG